MPAENSQFHGRLFQPLSVAGSCDVSGTALPKVGVSHGPHSPLVKGFSRLQSGMLLWFESVTLMAVLVANAVTEPGLRAAAVAIVSPATPRAAETFSAVLPLPKRSYAAPNRGLMSFQSTTFKPGIVCTARFGRYCVGPIVVGSYDSFCRSNRSAPVSVRRFMVQRSCAKMPVP